LAAVEHRTSGRAWTYRPDLLVAAAWVVLLAAAHFVFRDDESLAQHAIHAGLWVSLSVYVVATVRRHRGLAS